MTFEIKNFPQGFELKPEYSVSCANCGHQFLFLPSFAMQTNLNTGHGSCPICKVFLRLYIEQQENVGKSLKWEDTIQSLNDQINREIEIGEENGHSY